MDKTPLAVECRNGIEDPSGPVLTRRYSYLIQLGLWAEKHGIPAIEDHADCGADRASSLHQALAALPKEPNPKKDAL